MTTLRCTRLMTNLAGHDMESVLDAFHAVDDDRPTCFIAYTIKGYGLPFAGHKDNHAGLMNPDQMASFQRSMAVSPGSRMGSVRRARSFAGAARRLSRSVPLAALGGRAARRRRRCAVPPSLPVASRRTAIDAGSLRPAAGRHRRRRQRPRRAHRDDLARCHGLDQSRALGQSPRHFRPRRARRHVSRGEGRLGAALGDGAAGPAHRARHRREQSLSAAGGARPRRHRSSARGCCRSARSTIRSSSAASMR